MADYDSFSYDINSRLPEWWKNDALALPINEYTQQLISDLLEALLSSFGVVQPLNVWKTIPYEYNYYHHFVDLDENLVSESEEGVIEKTPVCKLFSGDKMYAYLPNTKRRCHANIHLKLTGGDISDDKQTIDELKITNGFQEILIENISKISTIDILTESNQILIDGKERVDLVEGYFNKIQPTIKYSDYKLPDIDKEIDIEDENKETFITLQSSDNVNFDLQIYLLKPTYTTEQNIRINTVSAFPIEWVRLYGYFCHPFNNKEGYKFLWEKKYTLESRTVYDRITKQYDCERFYIQVKFYGIGAPIMKGFPQEEYTSNKVFQTNPNLDKWGKIYGLPRRHYKDDITEDEEPYTFPQYYNYPIEQDYWYEERMVNEYRYDDEYINSAYIKDSDFNNVARLECIYPFMNELWVYTETINPDSDMTKENKDAPICDVEEVEKDVGKSINEIELLKEGKIEEITLIDPLNNETMKNNQFNYQTKRFKVTFCLSNIKDDVPKDIKITGIELKFKSSINLQSNSLRLTDDSCIELPFVSNITGNSFVEDIIIAEPDNYWEREKDYYVIGGKDYLFKQDSITREQLFSGNDKKLSFKIGFINESDFLQARLLLENISLHIYYETINDDYTMSSKVKPYYISLDSENQETELTISLKNNTNKKIENKELFIILPPELEFGEDEEGNKYYNHYNIHFNPKESFDIITKIKPKEFLDGKRTGAYDIVIFSEELECREEIVVRSKQ